MHPLNWQNLEHKSRLTADYVRTLSPAKQILLFAALFVTYANLGFCLDIVSYGRLGAVRTLLLSSACGLALGGIVATQVYFPQNIRPVSIAMGAIGGAFGIAIAMTVTRHHTAPWAWRDAAGMLVSLLCTYALLFWFIGEEGQKAIRLQAELRLAQGIQQTLVPVIHLRTAHYEMHGVSAPSDQVGGDLVDVVQLDEEVHAYVADIAGHGLPAGILMGMLKAAARTSLLSKPGLALQMEQLNQILPQVKEPQMYATFAGLRLRPSGVVEYAVAGHPPILHYRATTEDVALLGQEQFPLGLLPMSGYSSLLTQLHDGDILLIATDGILETCNQQEEEFGVLRLSKLLSEIARLSVEEISTRVLAGVRQHGAPSDDQTLLIVRAIGVSG